MHWLNCISPIEPKAQEVVPLKITTSYLSFYCCWFIEPFFECIKEFSRIVCVSLFSYQGYLFFCLSDSSFTLSHLFLFVKNFFQVFSNFFDVLLSNSLSRWQLVYFTTSSSGCQQVFLIFWSFLFLQKIKRRRRDLNPRAGYPTYTLSRGTSSASWVLLQTPNS